MKKTGFRAKFKGESKYLSIAFIPHSTKKIKVYRISAFYSKLAALAAFILIVFACIGLFIANIIEENNRLKVGISSLYALNMEQRSLLAEKADEISGLKLKEKNMSEKVKEFIGKYRELTDSYVSSRVETGRISRSALRDGFSFNNEIKELRSILQCISEINNSGSDGLADLDETEQKLVAYLDSLPSLWPVIGRISSAFGVRRHPIIGRRIFHEGIDIAASFGYPVKASASGKIVFAGARSGYGRTVIIDHGNGLSTWYGHASKLLVKEGQTVKKGDIVAKVGSSGLSTGPHLHFEIRINDEPVDPLKFLDNPDNP